MRRRNAAKIVQRYKYCGVAHGGVANGYALPSDERVAKNASKICR